jgi:urate oxidase
VKNTINIIAKSELGEEIEGFAATLGAHFLKKYSQISSVRIEISERLWSRMSFGEKAHDHSFVGSNQERPFTKVVCARGKKPIVQSGISDLVILKTTASGFENYPKCDFTTIPETNDRILATSLEASWDYETAPKSYLKANSVILEAMMKAFTKNYSPSLQKTLHEMAEAGFKAVKQVQKISLKAPNMHCLLINLAPFGLENKNEIFVPTTEPHGQIEGDFER